MNLSGGSLESKSQSLSKNSALASVRVISLKSSGNSDLN